MYDKGLMNFPREWITTIQNKNIELELTKNKPEFVPYLKAFKAERSQIERVFGLIITKFNILQKPFKGRGDRYTRLAQIFLLATQLTNFIFKYEQITENKTSLVKENPPKKFSELLTMIGKKNP